MIERSGAVTLSGQAMTLVGPELKAGERAPEFSLLDSSLKAHTLGEFKGKVKLISVVPSLDTEVCSLQTKRFDKEVGEMGEGVAAITVSMDLPFAQGRFCGANSINSLVLSDHREARFGTSYGVLIKEMRLLARSVFVVNKEGIITHVEYVKEVTSHPNYDKALEALKAAKEQ